MTYRRPAVTVIQEFLGLVPALASFNLPSVAVGPAYQLVDNDNLGSYTGSLANLAYASVMAGAQVDTAAPVTGEPYPVTKKPVSVAIKSAQVQIVAPATTGSGSAIAFSDATGSQFAAVKAGDKVIITEADAVTVLAAQTNGVTSNTARNQLTAGSSNQFANVKVGDSVVATGGTNVTPATYHVSIVVSANVLLLDGNINTGVGAGTNAAYSITGNRGDVNKGTYTIQTVTDANNLVLTSPLPQQEALIRYSIVRPVAEIDLVRGGSNGFTPNASNVTLPVNLTYTINSVAYPIVSGTVYASYRALRNDMAASVTSFNRLSDLQAFFGVSQITPANPLAFGLSTMLQNTTTPVNGLGCDGNAASNESLSYQNACDVLALTDMYAIVPLTQNPDIHQIFKTHVDGLSASGKERVVIINRQLKTEAVEQVESTTVTTINNSQIILNTQVTGAALVATPHTLTDATSSQFANVKPGDTVVIVGGTNATPGNYVVNSKTDNNTLVLGGANIVTGDATGIQYDIIRQDGMGSDGITFYDRNAAFISEGVAPGMIFRIMSGTYAGDYTIATVVSDHKLTVAQIPGIVSLVTAVDYEVVSKLTKDQQAAFLAGYSSSFADRRVVNVWPDTVSAPVGQTLFDVPGFYAGCSVGAMTTGLPTQQGFTNLAVSGFLGLSHSTGYFTDTQLDVIAAGGTFIFAQAVAEAPLHVRHQLTTDLSAIKFQEFSVTKNVDYISKYIRQTYAPFIGAFNIVDTTFDELKGTAKGIITFLRESTRLPRIGGVIKSGVLSLLQQSDTNIDAITVRFSMDIPIPLNNLDITVQA